MQGMKVPRMDGASRARFHVGVLVERKEGSEKRGNGKDKGVSVALGWWL